MERRIEKARKVILWPRHEGPSSAQCSPTQPLATEVMKARCYIRVLHVQCIAFVVESSYKMAAIMIFALLLVSTISDAVAARASFQSAAADQEGASTTSHTGKVYACPRAALIAFTGCHQRQGRRKGGEAPLDAQYLRIVVTLWPCSRMPKGHSSCENQYNCKTTVAQA